MSEELWKRALKYDPSSNIFKVLVHLSFLGEPCAPARIAEETGILPGTVRPALRSLDKAGLVERGPGGTYKSKIPLVEIVSDILKRLQRR